MSRSTESCTVAHYLRLFLILPLLLSIVNVFFQLRISSFRFHSENQGSDTRVDFSQPLCQKREEQKQPKRRSAVADEFLQTTKPVGKFNSFDLYHIRNPPPRTKIHCVGENFRSQTSLMYRMCEYQSLCYDLTTNEFVIFEESLNHNETSQLPKGWLSSTLRNTLSLKKNLEVSATPRNGKADPYFGDGDANIFAPIYSDEPKPSSYFVLDAAVIPFYRYKIGYRNPGHHAWQELVSIYTLIETFDMQDEHIYLAPLWQEVSDQYYREGPEDMMVKIGSKAMGHSSYSKHHTYWDKGKFDIQLPRGIPRPKWLCPKFTLTGFGQVGSHATHFHNGTHLRNHGRMSKHYDIPPLQHGKGGFYRRMRSFMMRNLGVPEYPLMDEDKPAHLLFAMNSSTREPRASIPLNVLMGRLQSKTFSNSSQVHMEAHIMHTFTIEEQAKMLSKTKAFFIAVGGGTFPAIFLPEGSHLVLFYDHELLDWDYWNNIPHIRVHWIPYQHVADPTYLPLFERLLKHILESDSSSSKDDGR